MPAAAAAARVLTLAIAALKESPLNPRKTFGDLAELIDSVREKGILQPILVRPLEGEEHEIVDGHRRVRAADAAGLVEVPALVRKLDDREVLEVQLITLLQRRDVHPIEEADALRVLNETHHLSIDEISAQIGKGKDYVARRLRLCVLVPEAREKVLSGAWSLAIGERVARLPLPELQSAAVVELEHYQSLDLNQADHVLRSKFQVRLDRAPFKLDVVDLVEFAGPCTTCPKRAANQPMLFADVAQDDLCTDPGCYEAKRVEHAARLRTEAESKGLKVLSGQESKQIFPYGARNGPAFGARYVQPDDVCDQDPKLRHWKKLLGKKAPAVVLCPTDEGSLVELYDKKEAAEALKAAGHKFRVALPGAKKKSRSSGGSKSYQAQQAQQRELERRKLEVLELALAEMVAAVKEKPAKAWGVVLADLLEGTGTAEATAKRRGCKSKDLGAAAKSMDDGQRLALALELGARVGAIVHYPSVSFSKSFKAAAEVLGVDLKKLEAGTKKKAPAKKARAA